MISSSGGRRRQGLVCDRVDSHLLKFLFDVCVPMVFDFVVGSTRKVRRNLGPSGIYPPPTKKKNTKF